MKKNKTKSLLACAVLASVLGIGNMVQAATTDTAVRDGQTFYFGNFWQSWDEEKTGESWTFQNDSVTPNQLILDAKNSKDPEKWAKAGDINNYKKEPIRWVVLGNNNGVLNLISKNALYGAFFDTRIGDKRSQIWGASEIRKTLNGGKNMSGMGTDTNGDGTLENVGFAGDAFTDAEWALLADHKTYFESHIPVYKGEGRPENEDPSLYITSPTDPLLSDVGYIKDETAVERRWDENMSYGLNISNYYVNDKVYLLSAEDEMNPQIREYLKDKDFHYGRRGFTDFTTCVGIYGHPTGGAYVGEGWIPDTNPLQWGYTGAIFWGHSRSPGDSYGSTYSTLYTNLGGNNPCYFNTTDTSLPGGMPVHPVVDLNLKNLIFTTAADKWNVATQSHDACGKLTATAGNSVKFADIPQEKIYDNTGMHGIVMLTLDLWFDDTKNSNRVTGDVQVGDNLTLDGSKLKIDYTGGKAVPGSYVSAFFFDASAGANPAYSHNNSPAVLSTGNLLGYGKGNAEVTAVSGTTEIDMSGLDAGEYKAEIFNENENGTVIEQGWTYIGARAEVKGTFEVVATTKDLNYTVKDAVTLKNIKLGTNNNLSVADGGSLTIAGTLDLTAKSTEFVANRINFPDNSVVKLTVTDGGEAKLKVTDTTIIAGGAKIEVEGANKGETYKIFKVEDGTTPAVWSVGNIRGRDANGHKVKGKEYIMEGNDYSVLFKTALPENNDITKILENADGTPLADWTEKVCDYFDTAYGDAGEAYTANAINSMASASVLAGAQKGAATMVTQVAGNISANVGVGARPTLSGVRGQVSGVRNVSADVKLASPLEGKRADKGAWSGEGVDETAINTVEVGKASEVMPTEYKEKVYDKQVWASYIHSKQKIDGLKTGSLTQNSTIQLNGVTVGTDLWSNAKGFGGLAITYADGNANSAQMSNSTKNEAKYYGISMYHRQDMGKYALTTDIGYTYNKNDITQHTTGITEEVTSKPKTHAYTVGMKLEREIYLSKACKIVPFAGARYTRLQNRDFSNSLGLNTKVDNQNLVTVPVGLSFHSHLITTEGWKLGSILEGGYEWNFGNRHSTQEFGYGGAYNSIGFDVADRGQYFVKAALTAKHKQISCELGYRYSKGKSVRDNKWNFNVNFTF